jgi:alpha-methylacyl-CoA racemase
MNGLLDSLKVLDFTQNLPGPICSLYLADMGADVIKVEPPVNGDSARGPAGSPNSPMISYLHRNKKSLELDLKSDEGREAIYKLVHEYDIIIEGFRPGVMKRLGLDYETLKKIQPKLIYCSISGYGQDSPLAAKGGHDINYLARAGIASMLATTDGTPVLPAIQIADTISGNHAMLGILAACVNRHGTGKGQQIDVSLTDSVFSMSHMEAANFLGEDKSPDWSAQYLSGGHALYGYYKCADDEYLSMGALEPAFEQRVLEFFKCPLDKKSLADAIAKKTRAEWVELLSAMDMCIEPVLHMHELKDDANLKARGMIIEVDGLLQPALPIKFSGFKPGQPKSAPTLGADNKQILDGLK